LDVRRRRSASVESLGEEITLFEQSGRAQLGRSQAAAYGYGEPFEEGSPHHPRGNGSSQWKLADSRLSLAQDAFQRADYDLAFRWAVISDRDMPQAQTRALMAQILFAQGAFGGAADQARAAVAMGPAVDWRMLYSYYEYRKETKLREEPYVVEVLEKRMRTREIAVTRSVAEQRPEQYTVMVPYQVRIQVPVVTCRYVEQQPVIIR